MREGKAKEEKEVGGDEGKGREKKGRRERIREKGKKGKCKKGYRGVGEGKPGQEGKIGRVRDRRTGKWRDVQERT